MDTIDISYLIMMAVMLAAILLTGYRDFFNKSLVNKLFSLGILLLLLTNLNDVYFSQNFVIEHHAIVSEIYPLFSILVASVLNVLGVVLICSAFIILSDIKSINKKGLSKTNL